MLISCKLNTQAAYSRCSIKEGLGEGLGIWASMLKVFLGLLLWASGL